MTATQPPPRARGDSLAVRFIVVGAVFAAMLGVMFIALVIAVGQLRDSLREAGRSDGVIAAAARTERLTVDLETGLRGYLLTGDDRFLDPTREAQRAVVPQARELRRLVADDPAQAQRAAAIERSLTDYSTGYVKREIAAGADRARSELMAATREGKGLVDPIRAQIDGLTAAERRRAVARETEADATEHRSFVIRAIGFAILVLSFALGIAYLVRSVLAPVRDVAAAAGRLAGGEPGARAPERGAGEVAALARSFNAMADALEVSRTELEHRGVRLGDTNRELRNAYKELERSKQQTILELSTPVLQLASRVLVLPIIGALDEERAHQIDDRLLAEVRARRARVVVIDVTGVPEIDSRVAGQLLGTVAALRLLGSRVIMTGISGELAAALVALNIDFRSIDSYADLQGGVESATGNG